MIQHPRAVDFEVGKALIVTDLHGEGAAYDHIRDTFLAMHAAGRADRLIICGDLIHGYGDEADDQSLRMILDVMRLQHEMGKDTIVMLMGNHEMPHVYNIVLSKGHLEFTSRFEQSLTRSGKRDEVMEFIYDLPLYARTKAGVLITHAGATVDVASADAAENILTFDHRALLKLADDRIINGYDLNLLRQNPEYMQIAEHYFAISGTDDPRLHHYLRGQMLSQNEEEFRFLWEVLFTTNENGWSVDAYSVVVDRFLRAISAVSEYPQRVLVAGHIAARNGYALVGDQHFRLASYAHAAPKENGKLLLLDCEEPIYAAEDLIPHLLPTFA